MYIPLIRSAKQKVLPWQMVHMVKSISDQAVFQRKPTFKKVGGREVLILWLMGGVSGGRELAVFPTSSPRARQTGTGPSSVRSLLISRGLATGIFIQKCLPPLTGSNLSRNGDPYFIV